MADEVKCAQCDNRALAVYQVEPGRNVAFCLTHSAEYERMLQRRVAMYTEQMRRLDDDMDVIAGLPRTPRPAVHHHQHTGDVNSINVVNSHGATVAVRSRVQQANAVNAGLSDGAVKAALDALVAGIAASQSIDEAKKDEALQLTTELAEQAKKSGERPAVVRGLLVGLRDVLSTASDLLPLLQAVASSVGF